MIGADPDGPGPPPSGRRKARPSFSAHDDIRGVSTGTAAVVVVPDVVRRGELSGRDPEARLAEAKSLAAAIALDVVGDRIVRIRAPKPATLFGAGQVRALAELIAETSAALLIVDGALSALQQRNLETESGVKVIDRTGLILEIFGERAASREGQLQVELAHLGYQASRLVRSWTHLERQRGGYGFLGGPGETQIETDRRLIRARIAKLKRELAEVTRTRGIQRRRRQKAPYPVIALVGYTNAGKSTLFNRLTGASVMAEDLVFATLDPTMRAIELPGIDKAILSDTVGFISDLPTTLIAAFKATLEEVREADLIVHVRDIAHPESEAQRRDVHALLAELGIERDSGAQPIIEAWNKIDLVPAEARARLQENDVPAVPVSALTGEGLGQLRARVSESLLRDARVHTISLAAADGQRMAWLENSGLVLQRHGVGDRIEMRVRLSAENFARFEAL